MPFKAGQCFGRGQRIQNGFFDCFGDRLKKGIEVMMGHHLQVVQVISAGGEVVAGSKGQKDVAAAVMTDSANAGQTDGGSLSGPLPGWVIIVACRKIMSAYLKAVRLSFTLL